MYDIGFACLRSINIIKLISNFDIIIIKQWKSSRLKDLTGTRLNIWAAAIQVYLTIFSMSDETKLYPSLASSL